MAANNVLLGFVQLHDQFMRRASEVGEESIAAAIGLTVESHNRAINAMLNLFGEFTTEKQVRYTGLGNGELQPVDENGRLLPIKVSTYTVGFPIGMAGAAIGFNWVALRKATVQKVNDLTAAVLRQDINYLARRMMTALFQNASYTYPDPDSGNITVYGMANADTTQYVFNGGDSLATDTHYLAQANSIDDSNNPFPTIETELIEHPENGGSVVAFIPTNLKDSVKALADYIPVSDPDVRAGGLTDVLTGNLSVSYPGTVIGKVGTVWIVEWTRLPSSYIIATTTDGDAPLAVREDEEEDLRGLRLQGIDEATPWHQRNWFRRVGFGGRNRVGALVYRIGNGSYAIPTGYDSTLA